MLLKDVGEKVTVANTKNVILDMHGHTDSYNEGAIVNNGILTIKNGSLASTTANAIANNKTLILDNMNITNSSSNNSI